ncbi:MAG: hypothetical protein CR997_13070 [Acidobacteria bacterium]|nr:MAG: hypothetical protein CR997_13070 [Acidobacteriota bacterium]
MSQLRIACLLAPMVDTEGPMDVVDGKVLNGPKKIMGKYGEVGLEAAITFAEENKNCVHLDLLSIGTSKELKALQQNAIAMIQPAKLPGTLAVHALELDNLSSLDAFAVGDLLFGMIDRLEKRPDLLFIGKDSNDYCHGIVGTYLAAKLQIPYFTGASVVALDEGFQSVTTTFNESEGKTVKKLTLPVALGTTDSLNGKDSARFTSLKGVMMAKKFKRNILSPSDLGTEATNRTEVLSAEEVKKDRKNQRISDGEGAEKVSAAMNILVNVDKALERGDSAGTDASVDKQVDWSGADSVDFSGSIVLLADHDGHKVRLSTSQALTPVKKLSAETGKKVTLVVCAENLASLGASLSAVDVDRVVGLESSAFKHATGMAVGSALLKLFDQSKPDFFFTVANDLGHDTAAFLASRLGSSFLPGLSSVELDEGKIKGVRIVANARYTTTEKALVDGTTQVASFRPTAFDPAAEGQASEFIKVNSVEIADTKSALLEFLAGVESSGIPLAEAKTIISGGRGMKAKENFAHLEELASLLGGAVGGSRAVTDLEWIPHNLQIGQTGETVAPDIYIAIGISGAIQHLTGMNDSKYIVAINSDEEAPIHQHADLSIIDKWENVLPSFIEAVKETL